MFCKSFLFRRAAFSSVNPLTLYVVVPAEDSVAAVAQVRPALFDSSTSSVAEKVPEILTVVVPAFGGRTFSQTQLVRSGQFVDCAVMLPVAEFWA